MKVFAGVDVSLRAYIAVQTLVCGATDPEHDGTHQPSKTSSMTSSMTSSYAGMPHFHLSLRPLTSLFRGLESSSHVSTCQGTDWSSIKQGCWRSACDVSSSSSGWIRDHAMPPYSNSHVSGKRNSGIQCKSGTDVVVDQS